jgi:GTPase-associated protein 1, N-terminal domain type 2/GTPase-associated protein 1, C-terminal domain/GTPase-associated protein 1, middle domain
MAFQQLYYTSCERGLSGFPGYQFNAVTPGVAPEVMRQVEALTAYEPPRSLGYRPTEPEIAASPVSLCFSPDGPVVMANVVFVGADFSQRFGNYFAHAIVTGDPAADLGPILPVELWQAPFWVREVSPTVELPELPGPPPTGPVDRAGVQAFVDRHRSASKLPTLLSAADRAIATGDRSVVIVESDAGSAASWIAAISYLLPPATARRMSFTTYHHRPSYCRLHVIGTVPDADVELDGAGFDSFHLFDFTGARASELEVHPLASLLARVGPRDGAVFWDRASALAAGTEASLDDWYPAATVAAAEHGMQLDGPDLDVAVQWFATRGGRLGAERVSAVGAVLLDQPQLGDRHLPGLAAAAHAAGATELQEGVERRLVDAELVSLLAGQGPSAAAPPAHIASTAAKAYATRRCAEELEKADVATAVPLLGWAADIGVELDRPVLVACGQRVVGPQLLRTPPDDTMRRLLAAWPGLLSGVTTHLAGVAAGRPDQVETSLDQGVASLLREQDVAAHPRLHELQIVSLALRQPAGRTEALARVLAVRSQHGTTGAQADGALLGRLWPGGAWSLDDARRVLDVLDHDDDRSGEAPEWLTEVLGRPIQPDDDESVERYLGLCRRLVVHPIARRLPARGEQLLNWAIDVDRQLVKARHTSGAGVVKIAKELAGRLEQAGPVVRVVLLRELPGLLVRVPPDDLDTVLAEMPEPVFDAFMGELRPQLERGNADPGVAARMFLVMLQLEGAGHAYARTIGRHLLDTLPDWRKRDLELLVGALARLDPEAVRLFDEWREGHHKRFHGRIGQLLHRRQRKGPAD